MIRKVYILEGLDCPNCAAKIEARIGSLQEVENASVTYANKQLRVSVKSDEGLRELLQSTVDAVEDGVTVVERAQLKIHAANAGELTEFIQKTVDPMNVSLIQIFAGAVLFLGVEAVHRLVPGAPDIALNILLVVSYLILGGKVLMTALCNIKKGQVFDENFLMSIATLGAFATNQFDEAVGVMLFYRIGEYFEQRATNQSRSQIMDAVDMRPEVVNLVTGDEIRVMGAEEAEVGDILLVRPGDRIPLDGVVVEGESRIDTSPVTGEPVPVKAAAGDNVISGCVNTSGVLKIRVEKVLEESMVSRILDSVENAAASKPQIDKFITRFSRVYTPFVVFMALAVAFLPNVINLLLDSPIMGKEPVYWVTTALTFLVISCPCALVLSVPLAFFSGIGAGSKKGILFKGGVTIESLTAVKAVVMDKTGTITEGNFAVQKAVPSPDSGIEADQLLALAASCELSSTHPIGISIVAAAGNKALQIERPAQMQEFAGKGIRAVTGAGEILCGNRKLMETFHVNLSEAGRDGAGTEVLVAVNGMYAGNILIADTIKKEAKGAIARTKALGIVTAMLTGDAQENAEAVAAETGIDEIHARLMPQEKLEHLQKIREEHGKVMFVGDGINDAPVLAGADVGAAMGSGADAAIEAADVVFMTSSMDAIPQAIDIARATSRISWQNVYFALGVKAIVMLLGLFGHASMWLAVFADTGVSMLCLLNSMRILYRK
ncbi:MAG: heavy metal translocating P-type ATPase [Anaerovoracaceae bacterium]